MKKDGFFTRTDCYVLGIVSGILITSFLLLVASMMFPR